MKMMRSTSITSTIGVTLISAIGRRRGAAAAAAAATLQRGAHVRPPPVELPREDHRELVREALVAADHLVAVLAELVVEDHRRDRGEQAERGREQRLGDAGGDDGEVGRLLERDLLEGMLDAPDRAEEPDEGRDRADRREEVQPLGQAGRTRAGSRRSSPARSAPACPRSARRPCGASAATRSCRRRRSAPTPPTGSGPMRS